MVFLAGLRLTPALFQRAIAFAVFFLTLALTPLRADPASVAWTDLEKLTASIAKLDSKKDTVEDFYNLLTLIRFRAEDYIKAFPSEPHHWDAEVIRLRVAEQIEPHVGHKIDWNVQQAAYAAVLAAPEAKRESKVSAQIGALNARLAQYGSKVPATELAAFSTEADALYAKNRRDVRLNPINYNLAMLLGAREPARAESLLQRIADTGDPLYADKATTMIHVVRSQREPLALKFKSLDGTATDLAALRGKVVLLDFWATWCPPCRAETPGIVATYQRFHDRGFEIVGISLDDDRGKLLTYLKQNQMTWPQHFDGAGWENSVAQRFGIHSIPAMWLIDQKGRIVNVEGREHLAEKIELLLGGK